MFKCVKYVFIAWNLHCKGFVIGTFFIGSYRVSKVSEFNLGNFKGGHFHSISDENKTLPNISPLI